MLVLDSCNCLIYDVYVIVIRDGYVFDSMFIFENDGSCISLEFCIVFIENVIFV